MTQCFNTVNGKHCCNPKIQKTMLEKKLLLSFNTVNGKYCCNSKRQFRYAYYPPGFNTVNGKYCCNSKIIRVVAIFAVSIP